MSRASNWDTQAKVWGATELHDSRHDGMSREVRKGMTALLQRLCPRGKILDVGGYRGLQVEGLANLERSVCVHDLSLPALREARARVSLATFGDIHRLPYAAHSVDLVLLSHVLEHSPEPGELLGAIRQVLKPEGTLVVVVPNMASLGQIWKLIRHGDVKPAGNPPWSPPEHLHQFTLVNASKFLADEGWQLVHAEGDILDFPLLRKTGTYALAARLGRWWTRRAESLVLVCRSRG
ncbi:MAG: class I SAM-dependent methyltransferase [Planctomycetota bacterium]